MEPVPKRRLRARNMPEVTGVRQGGKLSRSGLRPGVLCSLSWRCCDVAPAGLPARKTPVIKPSLTVFGPARQPSSKIFPPRRSCAGFIRRDYCFGFRQCPVVKSIKQRDLLNTWLRLYARQQTAPAIWEYQPARLEEELSDLIYYTVDDSTPTPGLTIQSKGTRISRAYGHTGKGILLEVYVGPQLAPFVMPAYHECLARGLPVYSVADVVESADQSGPGVTAEIIELN